MKPIVRMLIDAYKENPEFWEDIPEDALERGLCFINEYKAITRGMIARHVDGSGLQIPLLFEKILNSLNQEDIKELGSHLR